MRKFLLVIASMVLVVTLLPILVNGADTFPINLNNVDRSGEGWNWDADSKTLTLSGINWNSEKQAQTTTNLPAHTKIILTDGTDNFIQNEKVGYAIVCDGDLSISGGGNLTVMSGESGIYAMGFLMINVSGILDVDGYSNSIYSTYGIEINNCNNILLEGGMSSCGPIQITDSSVYISAPIDIMVTSINDAKRKVCPYIRPMSFYQDNALMTPNDAGWYQWYLIHWGYEIGKLDLISGPRTWKAIHEVQLMALGRMGDAGPLTIDAIVFSDGFDSASRPGSGGDLTITRSTLLVVNDWQISVSNWSNDATIILEECSINYPAEAVITSGSIYIGNQRVGAVQILSANEEHFEVIYDGNGGTSSREDKHLPYTANTSAKVSSNGFTRSGYTFAGWNTAADGSGTTYEAEDTIYISEDVTLFAQWTKV
jgi:uncharacterized repeat protein (TIGR02543 family)